MYRHPPESATMLSGAAVTYANMTDVYSRTYKVYGTACLNVTTRYTSIPGPWDRVMYNLSLNGKAADKEQAETNNQVYVTRNDGKKDYKVYLYENLYIGSACQSFGLTETIWDSKDIVVRSEIGYGSNKYCYAENPKLK